MTAIVTASFMAVIGIAALTAWHSHQWHRERNQWRRELMQAQLDRASGREHRTEDEGYAELLARAAEAPLGYPYDWETAALDAAYSRLGERRYETWLERLKDHGP